MHPAVVESLSHVRLSAALWATACQASLSFAISQSLLFQAKYATPPQKKQSLLIKKYDKEDCMSFVETSLSVLDYIHISFPVNVLYKHIISYHLLFTQLI